MASYSDFQREAEAGGRVGGAERGRALLLAERWRDAEELAMVAWDAREIYGYIALCGRDERVVGASYDEWISRIMMRK